MDLGDAVITELKVIGVDPGGTTGYCIIWVPRLCIYDPNRNPAEILEVRTGELYGEEVSQAKDICGLARTTQSLDYGVGPAVVVEDWDQDPRFKSTDPEALSPVRIGAMLRYAHMRNEMSDARLVFQKRGIAKETFTDDRLHAARMYTKGSDHIRDATRHALTALRRARSNNEFRMQMWVNDSVDSKFYD
jgi:hypothetical protein